MDLMVVQEVEECILVRFCEVGFVFLGESSDSILMLFVEDS